MQSHETDFLLNPESHQAPARRKDDADSAVGAEALIHGRTDALTPSAVMHLQKTAGNEAVTSAIEEQEPSPVKDVVGTGGGSPLDRGTRGFMESRLGADFGDVRIHTDSKASESARSVQAYAYTVGNDVVFQSGKYEPESESGQRMLAHELTHVMQQRSGPVAGTPAAGGIKISHPSDSFEQAAESNANQVMASAHGESVGAGSTSPSVQREAEEEEVQGTFVQRAEEEKEEEVQGTFVQRAEDEKEEEVQGTFVQRAEAEEEEGETQG
jgi:hypothetical protein